MAAFACNRNTSYGGGVGKLPRNDIYLPGVLEHTTKTGGKRHITEKPLALMRELVRPVRPGGLIVDPFAGSSATGEAALREGYQYHGIESVPGYYDISCQRLQETSASTERSATTTLTQA